SLLARSRTTTRGNTPVSSAQALRDDRRWPTAHTATAHPPPSVDARTPCPRYRSCRLDYGPNRSGSRHTSQTRPYETPCWLHKERGAVRRLHYLGRSKQKLCQPKCRSRWTANPAL